MDTEHVMRLAIREAQEGKKEGNLPYGAVIIKEGVIISRGHNTVRSSCDPTAHAEVNTIRKAAISLGSRHLTGCTLISTCEPCPMCFSAAWWAGISRIVYGLSSPEYAHHRPNELQLTIEQLNKMSGSEIELSSGILKEECLRLFQ